MIGIHASVNWNHGKMQMRLIVKGRCEHPLEHLYTECIREGLRQALKVASDKELEMDAKLKETNIKIELPPVDQAAAEASPAPMGAGAMEIPFEPAPSTRPPSFLEFINGLMAEFNRTVEFEKAKEQPDDNVIVGAQAAAELVQEHAQKYMQQLLEWQKARAAAGGQGT